MTTDLDGSQLNSGPQIRQVVGSSPCAPQGLRHDDDVGPVFHDGRAVTDTPTGAGTVDVTGQYLNAIRAP
jgi:hypothetical protein